MAAPTFRAAGTVQSAAGTTTIVPGAPSGIATGDLEFMLGTAPDGNTVSISVAGGGAWTESVAGGVSVTLGTRVYCWYRIRAGGDSDPTIGSNGNGVMGSRFCYQTGTFDTSDPLEIESSGSNASSDTSFSAAPGTSTTGVDRMVVLIGASRRDSGTANFTAPANATLTGVASSNNFSTTAGPGSCTVATRGSLASAGAIGTYSDTLAVASPDTWISFAINPAAVVPVKNLSALGVG